MGAALSPRLGWGFQVNPAAAVKVFLLCTSLSLGHCEISLKLAPTEEDTKSRGTFLCSIAIFKVLALALWLIIILIFN